MMQMPEPVKLRSDGTGRVGIKQRERDANQAADQHFTMLHHTRHDSGIPYWACEECKKAGWR